MAEDNEIVRACTSLIFASSGSDGRCRKRKRKHETRVSVYDIFVL